MNCSTSGFESLPNYGLPCALTGVLCALSGISGVEVLVNGPSSCTGFSTGVLDSCNPLQERNSRHFSRLAALGHPRIPCSEITDADVILGTGEKLIRAVDILAQKRKCACIVIVNSCSLSLIGEDAATIMAGHPMADKILYLESASCGKPMATGYADALICLMDHLAEPGSLPGEPAVNILGLPPYQYSWKHDLAEIRRLMAMAGIRINTILSDNSPLESIRSVPRADLNLVITPGYGLAIARFLKERFNMPYISPRHMPIGFDATASLMSEVLDFFGLPAPSELTAEENRCRREALLALSHSSRSEMIRGLPVAAFGERDFTVGLTDFLKSYLGCCPVLAAVQGADDGDAQGIARAAGPDARILFNPDPGLAMEAVGQAKPAILFGSSFERYIMDQMSYHPRFFVETGLPRFNRANLVFRPHIGFAGALTFIEAVLNCPLTPAYPYTAGGNASRFQGPILSTD